MSLECKFEYLHMENVNEDNEELMDVDYSENVLYEDSEKYSSEDIIEQNESNISADGTKTDVLCEIVPESRSRSTILADIHEAKCKVDYHQRRSAALSSQKGMYMAKGEHERAARSWGHRLEKLYQELRNCDH